MVTSHIQQNYLKVKNVLIFHFVLELLKKVNNYVALWKK